MTRLFQIISLAHNIQIIQFRRDFTLLSNLIIYAQDMFQSYDYHQLASNIKQKLEYKQSIGLNTEVITVKL